MLTLILILLGITTLTVVMTLGVWYWFNKGNQKALQIKEVSIEIGKDASKLIKGIKNLSELVSEVAQPLLSPAAIDIESEDVKDDMKIDEENEEDVKVVITEEIKGMVTSEVLEEVKENVKEDVMDEVEVFTELIQK